MAKSAPDLVAEAAEGNPYSKLGSRFWRLWWSGFLAIVAAFVATMIFVAPHMGSLLGAIGGGAAVIGFTSALIGLSMAPMRTLQKRGLEGPMRPAYRRYTVRFLPAMMGYVVLLIAAIMYWQAAQPEGAIAWLVALAPSLPLLLAIRAVVLLLKDETDEFLRERLHESYAWATGATLAICSVYGFLDLFEVAPHIQLWAVFPIWAVCLGFAQIVTNRKYR